MARVWRIKWGSQQGRFRVCIYPVDISIVSSSRYQSGGFTYGLAWSITVPGEQDKLITVPVSLVSRRQTSQFDEYQEIKSSFSSTLTPPVRTHRPNAFAMLNPLRSSANRKTGPSPGLQSAHDISMSWALVFSGPLSVR
jgi:hypothetical protein